ncbi:MAG: hypothetical protein Q9217_002009 [Psora testacea]
MLDCTARSTTGHERIPSSLLNIYVQYKQDTRAIIAWLVSHGQCEHRHPQTLYIKDLFDLAEGVQKKAVVMPDIIAFHFREAITARNYMTKFFRNATAQGADNQETINHEHFTTSLTKIYAGLCECCAQPRADWKRGYESRPSQESFRTSNRFSSLGVSCPDNDCCIQDEPYDFRCNNDAQDRKCKDTRLNSTIPPLVDDTLGFAFELLKVIEVICPPTEMDDLLAATKAIWEQAARGQVPLVMAAFINNAAFASFEEIEQRLKSTCSISNPEILRQKVIEARQDIGSLGSNNCGSSYPAATLVEILDNCWRLLSKLKSEGPSNRCKANARLSQSTSHLIIRQSPESTAIDETCHTVMLQDISHQIQVGSLCTGIIRLGSPVFPEVGYYLTHANDDSNSLRCSFGLQLLLNSYKGYLFALKPAPAPSGCRLQALKFAQDAIPSIRAVLDDSTLPCRCPGTLACQLENLRVDFKAFLEARMFDFYFQSPWVCGSHILEMLDAIFYYGLRLFSYRNFVGSVVHMYNVLRQFNDIEPIPLLDSLCTTFGEILFPGGRPCRNFKTCYMRYMGGRLRFHSKHKSGCHAIAIPANAAKAAAGFGTRKEAVKDARFDSRKTSVLFHIKDKGYHLDHSTWDRVGNLKDPSSRKAMNPRSCTHHFHTENDPSSCSPHHRLHSLQEGILTADFSGPFPAVKVNLFKVYLSCSRIVSIISDKYHGEDARPGQYCLCSVDALLVAADRCKDNECRLQQLGCKELVATCRDAIGDVGKGEVLEQYLWKHV